MDMIRFHCVVQEWDEAGGSRLGWEVNSWNRQYRARRCRCGLGLGELDWAVQGWAGKGYIVQLGKGNARVGSVSLGCASLGQAGRCRIG